MRTGYRLAIGVAAITIVIAIALFVIAVFGSTRDATKYGQVSVPGRASVNLPAGEVIVFYGELPGVEPDFSLNTPPDLRLQLRTASGQLLFGSNPYRSAVFTDAEYERRAVAKVRVPEAGNYEAVPASRMTGGKVRPTLSFGENGTRNFGYVLFVLAGGGLLAAILGIGTAIVARLEGD